MKPNTCLVVDVWEGQLEVDEAVLKANGVAGMAIRLNDMSGGHHMDTNFLKQWAEAKNFVRFPYFVYNPWVDGAANFAWLAANIPAEVKTVAVDVEVSKSGYAPATYAAEVAKFLNLCNPRWKVIIYTAQWFLPYISSWPRTVDYWWAQYPDSVTYFGGVKTWDELRLRLDRLDKPFNINSVPGPLKMWQFSGDYLVLPGNSRAIDVNIFYGTELDLANYINQVPPPPPVYLPGLYQYNTANYYPRTTGLPLSLPLWLDRQPGNGLVGIDWTKFKALLLRLNAANLPAVDLLQRADWGLNKGMDGAKIKWSGMSWPGRNILKIAEVVGAWGRVDGFGVFSPAAAGSMPVVDLSTLDLSKLNPTDNPELVHKVYDYNSLKGWAERAKPIYVPLLGGPWWVDMSKLLSVSGQLPKLVKITAIPRMNIRSAPSTTAAVLGYAYYSQSFNITEVRIAAGGVWGKIATGWIALRNNGTNYTTWLI